MPSATAGELRSETMMTSVLVAERQQRWGDERATATSAVGTRDRGATADSYWLAAVRPDGRAHVLPVLEVWLDGALYVSAGHFSGGSVHPADATRYVVSVARYAPDVVVEGAATRVSDEVTLRRVAAEYAARYGWQRFPRSGNTASDRADTLPYEVYRATPATAFGYGADATLDAIHWRF
jgi:hypothetical protein